MRFVTRGIIGLILLSLTLGLLVIAAQSVRSAIDERMSQEPRIPQERERVFSVAVVNANPQTIAPKLDAFGEIYSRRTLDLRMAMGGQVVELSSNFVEGGVVEQGEVLVRLDDATLQSALRLAENDFVDAETEVQEAARAIKLAQDELSAAQAQADLRNRAFDRQKDLEQRGVGTAAAVEAAELSASSAEQAVLARRSVLNQTKNRVSQAQTRLNRATLSVEDATRRLEDTVLRAEFTGLLAEVSLVKGGLVGANERLGQLIDPNILEVAFRVSTQQYSRLLNETGQLLQVPVDVSLSAASDTLTASAQLTRDSASVGQGQTGRLVFARMSNAVGFKPGDFVSVTVQEPELNFVISLPSTAIDASNSVLVLNEDDRLQEVQVNLIRRQKNDILIRSRDLIGKEVVTQRTPVLGAGIKVKPIRKGQENQVEVIEMVELSQERRAKLIAAVENNGFIPKSAKERIIGQLNQPKVPIDVINRIESRMGG